MIEDMDYSELVGTDFDYQVDCQSAQIQAHNYTVTIDLNIEKHFDSRLEAKDYAFCRHCFDGIEKHRIAIWDKTASQVSKDVWNPNSEVAA